MKAYGGVDVYIHIFLTSALAGGQWWASRPGRFTPEERAPGTRWIGGWVDPRVGLDDVEKWKFLTPPGLELRPLSRPASSQSLYRVRYRGSPIVLGKMINIHKILSNENRPNCVHVQSVGRVYCCWPSPAQSILVSVPVGTQGHIYAISKTFNCSEMGPRLRLQEGSVYYWSPLLLGVTQAGTH
jgi:hypothetical protein